MTDSVTDSGVRGLVRATISTARETGAAWWYLALAVGGLVAITTFQALRGERGVVDLLIAACIGVLTAIAAADARNSAVATARKREESETFTRILRALTRSVSPAAIVDAIVEELGSATEADHVAVVRLRSDGSALDATVQSTRPGMPVSNTELSAALLDPSEPSPSNWVRRSGGTDPRRTKDPDDEVAVRGAAVATAGPSAARNWMAAETAERIAYRLRLDYGLRNTLAAPIWNGERLIGAIVLSRRIDQQWAPSAARLLENAATESSAALSRVYSLHAAEVDARTDQLTQLPNRRYFDEWCSLVAERRRATDHLAILAIDVDNFKALNDRFGHHVGDEVLKAIGAAIQSCVRDDDVPARYGGEEFVVLLRNPGKRVPIDVGERIRVAVRDLDLSAVHVPGVSVSVGVAAATDPSESIAAVMDRADRALYAAKRAGRNRVIESLAQLD